MKNVKNRSKLDLHTTVLISGRQMKVFHLNMIYDGTGSVEYDIHIQMSDFPLST